MTRISSAPRARVPSSVAIGSGTRKRGATTKPTLDDIVEDFEEVSTQMEVNVLPGTEQRGKLGTSPEGASGPNNYARNKPTLVVCGTAMRWQFARLFNYEGDPKASDQATNPIGVDTGVNPYTGDRVTVVSVLELRYDHYYFNVSLMERPYYHLIWNYPVSASGDVRGRVDQTKLSSDVAYTLVACRCSEIIPANLHLAFWVQATWEQPERAFMDLVGHPVTATPVDVVAALSLLEGRYTLTNEAAPSVLCWLRDAPVSDVTTLRVADAFTIPPRPDDGWRASIELNDGGTIYVQSKQANADDRIVVADG